MALTFTSCATPYRTTDSGKRVVDKEVVAARRAWRGVGIELLKGLITIVVQSRVQPPER